MKTLLSNLRFSLGAQALLAGALLAPAATATWSIIAVNTRTGEVCIASATCLDSINLQNLTPVLRIGLGGACAQSLGDSSGVNRQIIWNDLIAGMSPEQILADLSQNDSHYQQRQYGIVNMADDPITFSGNLDGMAYYGVARVMDDMRYAIQGNVLTGIQVVTNAENALLATPGDLGQKVLAAMEAARVYGGDGRCSCNDGAPMSCGCPPPSFTYSAYTAFFVLARIGDVDAAACDANNGCCGGQYFCDLISISANGGPEPVIDLENRYAAWRATKRNLADQIRTSVQATAQRIPADGSSHADVEVVLEDINGHPVTTPATISIVDVSGTPVTSLGPIQQGPPGHFAFSVTSTASTGEGRFQITVHHPGLDVLLWPELVVRTDPPAELFSGYSVVSATGGADVPLWLDAGAGAAGSSFVILASASGTSPGTPFAGVQVPLNIDFWFRTSVRSAGRGRFEGTIGTLDANGRATGALVAPANLLYPWLGRHIDWSAVIYGSPNRATATDGFDISF